MYTQIRFDLASGKLSHLPRQRRLHPNPEGVVHHIVGIGQVAADTVVGTDHVGLASQVARKQQAGADLLLIQVG